MKYISLLWEIPRALWHVAIAFKNYAAGRGFTDEP